MRRFIGISAVLAALWATLVTAQLSRGDTQFQVSVPGLAGDGTSRPLSLGTWGGDGISLVASETGALVEFDCAHATIDGPVLVEPNGDFHWGGTYVQEHGGPTTGTEPEFAGEFSGTLSGAAMVLNVYVPGSGLNVVFVLAEGDAGNVHKCR